MKESFSFHTEIEKKYIINSVIWIISLGLIKNVIIPVFERQAQYFQNVLPDHNVLMLSSIFEYVNLYL